MMADEIPDFDLYAELEVSERASVETIQAAYRSLQLRHHPDRVGPGAGDRAVRLNIARDWLTDADRRSRYDALVVGARRRTDTPDAGVTHAVPSDSWPDDQATASSAGRDADDLPEDAGDETDQPGVSARGPLAATHILLRLDLARLVRLWLVGLAFLGALALAAAVTAAVAAQVAIGVIALLVLVALTTRRLRTGPDSGLIVRAKRTGWSMLGWLGLALLATDGLSTIALAMGRRASGPGAEAGVEAAIGPVLAATAVMSLAALHRRTGPVRATVDEFLEMTPREFEVAVGEILGRHRYRLSVTGGPGDLVADLTGTDPDGRPAIVQCKRYAPGHPVGSRDVQLLMALGVRHHRAEHLILVTTSDFTDPARDLAEEHGVELINGGELEELTR